MKRSTTALSGKTEKKCARDEKMILPGVKAADPCTPASILALLAQTTELDVLEKVGANPSTPREVLLRLCHHQDSEIRNAVIDNPNIPDEALEILTNDDDADIRYAVAENHNIALRFIEHLCGDYNPFVAARAQRTLCRVSNKYNLVSMPFSSESTRINGTYD
ncbi:MAG: hypothetical protein K2Z81_03725 [Cyanobacteria bacterium]|nr:hypothetical protein [Cyanobacteriota bacterium]